MKRVLALILTLFSALSFAQNVQVRTLEKKTIELPTYSGESRFIDLDKIKVNSHYYKGIKIRHLELCPHGGVRPYDYMLGIDINEKNKSKPYKAEKAYGKAMKTTGFPEGFGLIENIKGSRATPCNVIEGKDFTVLSIFNAGETLLIHLIDDEGTELCYCFDTFIQTPPFIIVNEVDSIIVSLTGKTFYDTTNDDKTSQTGCTQKKYTYEGITYLEGQLTKYYQASRRPDSPKLRYYLPCLLFKDSEGKDYFINPFDDISLYDFEYYYDNFDWKNGSITMAPFELAALCEVSEFETILANRKENEERDKLIALADEIVRKAKAKEEEEKKVAEAKRQQEEIAAAEKKAAADKRAADEKRKQQLYEKYGADIADLIINHRVRLGMTSEMCRESWGRPYEINRTTNIYGTSEQWVYKSRGAYLYFDNEILKSIQD